MSVGWKLINWKIGYMYFELSITPWCYLSVIIELDEEKEDEATQNNNGEPSFAQPANTYAKPMQQGILSTRGPLLYITFNSLVLGEVLLTQDDGLY